MGELPEHLRLFIGIELSGDVRDELSRLVNAFQQSAAFQAKGGGRVRWVPSENLHLTLRFIGPYPMRELPRLHEALSRIGESQSAFSFALSGCNYFPKRGSPRVLWAGVSAAARIDAFRRLSLSVEKACTDVGCASEEERDFIPHITLARVNGKFSGRVMREMKEKLRNECVLPLAQEVRELSLFESSLRKEGTNYRILRRYRLADNADS